MQAFKRISGKAAPLDRANVDTDAIIPKQYLKSIRRTGFGPFLFDDWRYLDPGSLEIAPETRRLNPSFVLNQSQHAGATMLVARENFGCGSSREHAVWALNDAGFRCVIAPSFADIFSGNCFKNGTLPMVLKPYEVQAVFELLAEEPDAILIADLPAQQLQLPDGRAFMFEIDAGRKRKMIEGLDEIGETLQHADEIRRYEVRRSRETPWLLA